MNILFYMGFIISLIFFIASLMSIIRNYEDKSRNTLLAYLFAMGLGYLTISVLFLVWALSLSDYTKMDLKLIYAILLISKSFLLGGFVYALAKRKAVFWILGFYSLALVAIFLSLSNSLTFSIIASLGTMFVLFLIAGYSNQEYKNTCWLGILYVFVTLTFQILLNSDLGNKIVFFILSTLLFLVWLFSVLKKIKECPQKVKEKCPKEESPYVLSFLRNFVFIIAFSVFILVGTIGLHELGHFAVSRWYNCEYSNIVYSGSSAYTQMLCENSNMAFLLLGGILLPIIMALILFAIGSKIIREAAPLIVGFSLISAYADLENLGLDSNLRIILMVLGAVSIAMGVAFLSKYRVEE